MENSPPPEPFVDAPKSSVTDWLRELNEGNNGNERTAQAEEAARKLLERYMDRVLRLAYTKFPKGLNLPEDEQDLAIKIITGALKRIEEGEFQEQPHRDDWWRIILSIAPKAVSDQIRWATAKKRTPQNGENTISIDEGEWIPAPDSVPEVAAELAEILILLPSKLAEHTDPKLKPTAEMWLDGCDVSVIAETLDVTETTIHRKLRLIRRTFEELLKNE